MTTLEEDEDTPAKGVYLTVDLNLSIVSVVSDFLSNVAEALEGVLNEILPVDVDVSTLVEALAPSSSSSETKLAFTVNDDRAAFLIKTPLDGAFSFIGETITFKCVIVYGSKLACDLEIDGTPNYFTIIKEGAV